MKTLLQTIALAALIALPLTSITTGAIKQATTKIHKVVFEVAIDGADKWEAALRNVENVQKSLGVKTTQIKVVAHGKGIGILLTTSATTNTEMKTMVEKLHDNGVVFAVCENTLKKMQMTKDQLIPLATTVDSGGTEVIGKQDPATPTSRARADLGAHF